MLGYLNPWSAKQPTINLSSVNRFNHMLYDRKLAPCSGLWKSPFGLGLPCLTAYNVNSAIPGQTATMDKLPPKRRSEIMSRIRGKDTGPEMAVRRLLHAMGYRFRLHRRDLPGKPDIVLPKHRTVIFVHGCFWHGCRKCDRGTRVPKTNTAFWVQKIADNCRRDGEARKKLIELGWRVIVLWQCEMVDPKIVRELLLRELPPVPAKTSRRRTAGP
jgi:DNA mismatch endonuclease, patch repair protein